MKLGEISSNIVVPLPKLHDYALDPAHSQGKHKAILFKKLGYTQEHAEVLQRVLLDAASDAEATFRIGDQYGDHYRADIEHTRPSGLHAEIRTTWIVPRGEDVIQLVSAWVRKLTDDN